MKINNSQNFELRVSTYDQTALDKAEIVSANEIEKSQTPPLPGVYALDMKIKISGTGGDGLRLRKSPGTDQDVLLIAAEDSEYLIVDGPNVTDSLVWWKIQNVLEKSKLGWAVQDYFSAFVDD